MYGEKEWGCLGYRLWVAMRGYSSIQLRRSAELELFDDHPICDATGVTAELKLLKTFDSFSYLLIRCTFSFPRAAVGHYFEVASQVIPSRLYAFINWNDYLLWFDAGFIFGIWFGSYSLKLLISFFSALIPCLFCIEWIKNGSTTETCFSVLCV